MSDTPSSPPSLPQYAAPQTPVMAYIHDDDAVLEADAAEQPPAFAVYDDLEGAGASQDEQGELDYDDDEWNQEEEDEEWAQMGAVEDEDWGGNEKDFAKQYNRLKQYQTAISSTSPSNATPSSSKKPTPTGSVRATPLPAINRSRQAPVASSSSSTPAQTKETRLSRLINLAPYAPQPSINTKASADRQNQKDKSDRATVEQVLDSRTRLVLVKMINKGLVGTIEGCVSTGKEANVYHAWPPAMPPVPTVHNPNPPELPKQIALKIFKTSILVFKDREKYITGEFRFKGGQSKNPRKMVRMWAEKEMRNLKRLEAAGIRCPRSLEVRENVLAMEFLGNPDGWPSMRLKDAEKHMDLPQKQEMYAECMIAIRKMYQVCKLVHADLSEYNILWHLQHVYIIDVSQSVEHDHPHAYDFLRSDLTNIAAFFKKCSSGSVRTLGLRKAFEFVTWGNVGEGLYGGEAEDEVAKRAWEDREWERCLGEWLEAGAGASQDKEDDDENSEGEVELVEEFKSTAIDASQDSAPLAKPPVASSSKPVGHANKSRRAPNYSVDLPDDTRDLDAAQDDLIFKSTYIPRSLAEVYDPERDVEAVNRGEGKDLEYIRTGGVGVVGVDDIEEEEEDDEEGSDDEDNDSDEEGEEGKDKKPKVLRGHRNEDRDAKKERKKKAKEEAAEKRKTKMPKKVKKRKVNQGKHDR